ncbi:subtilisin-like protein [Myriangium duriaei CBS 260.36]|uniref:Subtilisin-like protein n=1 Tax=Myriangium duriaei CBS 260.36 TaxID=1168546 RepID=A0A9P4MI10_9PEZI|nr:subtilisin-like protein [Myriangium duriaei CBS 260.36]
MCFLQYSFALFTSVLVLVDALSIPNRPSEDFDISDRYVVGLKDGTNLGKHLDFVQQLHSQTSPQVHGDQAFGGLASHFAIGDFRGYSGHFNSSVIEHLKSHNDVDFVEADKMLDAQTGKVEDNAPWNLVRISHRNTNNQPRQSTHYWYAAAAGAGTYTYILDSGINANHLEFSHRRHQAQGQSIFENGYHAFDDTPPVGPPADNHGHGTYIAAIVAGRNFGVAKSTNIVPVKIYDERLSVPVSRLVQAYNWAVNDITTKNRVQHSVINMSISGKFSRAVNKAIDAAYTKGISTAVPAGDQDSDAALMSPASSLRAIAAGATDRNRARLPFSNWGARVNIFAPGHKICSAWGGNERMIRATSGTAAAAAHVAGLIAYFKSYNHLRTAETTWEFLKITSVHGVVRNVKRGNNMFTYNFSGK